MEPVVRNKKMDSYFDIKALPNAEILQTAVVSHLMQQLHSVLPEYRGRIGLSFPAYGQQHTMGGIIRVLGIKNDVSDISQQLKNLPEVIDYSLVTAINPVPPSVSKYACFTRIHAKGKSRYTRIKKRHISNGTWTSEIEHAVSEKMTQKLFLPHINLRSASTGERFLLFLKRRIVTTPVVGLFNGYGLSKTTTVPWF